MARDYLTIASVPVDEECTPAGQALDQQVRECRAFMAQLRRTFGAEPDGARLSIKGFSHDFRTYYEVVCYYDREKADAVAYAFKLESEAPLHWDDEARKELARA